MVEKSVTVEGTGVGGMAEVGSAVFAFVILGTPGILVARNARGLARRKGQSDAWGSTRDRSEVEPALWNVWVTKLSGYALVLVAVAVAGMFVFLPE